MPDPVVKTTVTSIPSVWFSRLSGGKTVTFVCIDLLLIYTHGMSSGVIFKLKDSVNV